jgi:hypothetical protein
MIRATASAVAMALILCLSREAGAGGERPGHSGLRVPGTIAQRGLRSGGHVVFGHPHRSYRHPHVHPHLHHPRVFIISPYPNYLYYLPSPVVVDSPFFCVPHQVGFMGRAGMVDHLAGTHKFLLETAAALCPDGADNCIFPSY